jgi:DHA1 family multidrug resistance protein-like MFS transporter
MKLRPTLVAMMALSVLSDAILIPFYPLFFAQRYGETSALHAGLYVGAISLAVMTTLPLWARLARRIDSMHVLVWTQLAAGALSLMSYAAPSLPVFWLLSLPMFMCKSSYLLMYPYLMKLEPAATRAGTIGLLSVVAHLSAIFGAVLGGWIMQAWEASASVVAMAVADFIQAAICIRLIGTHRIARRASTVGEARGIAHGSIEGNIQGDTRGSTSGPTKGKYSSLAARLPIFRLFFVMLVFDLSVYLARPFFSVYWQQTGISSSETLAGFVFAIPGIVAIAALWINRRGALRGKRAFDHLVPNLLLAATGLLLQTSDSAFWIIAGRCLLGWALFQITVRLDVMLFRLSSPDAFAADHSLAYFFQNLGVLIASFAAGLIVEHQGLEAPFLFAAAGVVATTLLVVAWRTPADTDDIRTHASAH